MCALEHIMSVTVFCCVYALLLPVRNGEPFPAVMGQNPRPPLHLNMHTMALHPVHQSLLHTAAFQCHLVEPLEFVEQAPVSRLLGAKARQAQPDTDAAVSAAATEMTAL